MKPYIILILTGILFSCSSNNKKADAYGNFEATEIIISSESNGKVLSFYRDEGDILKKGDFACQLDSLQLHFKKNELLNKIKAIDEGLKIIDSRIKQVKIEKNKVDKEVKRFTNLVSSKAATQKQLDDLTFQSKINKEKINQMIFQKEKSVFDKKAIISKLDNLNDQIKKTKILSPITGTVLKKFVEENELVNYGKPLFSMANLKQLTLRAYTDGDQLSQIKIGQVVTVNVDIPNNKMKSYQGTITQISEKAEFTPKIIQTKDERVSQVYAIKIKVNNDGSLKIGMPAEVEF